MIYSGMGQTACYGGQPAELTELPVDIKKAVVEDLLQCVLAECGAYGMQAPDALRLGARLAGKDGWKEIPLAAWVRFVSKRNAYVEADQVTSGAHKTIREIAASVDKIG